jgi:hypothetical protein
LGWYQLFGMKELHQYLEYDDGVWFGTAVRLAHGILPYRSFVDDQPPGVPVAMLPFGLLSRWVGTRAAFAAARTVIPLVQSAGIVAVGRTVAHRGPLTVALACGGMAVYPVCLIDQRTVMLEPFCAALCLMGLATLFQEGRLSTGTARLVVAGAWFGLAGSCKAFAVLPFVAVAVGLWLSGARPRLVPFLAGTAGAFVLVCGPFFALAPGAFWRDVVVTQLTRRGSAGSSVFDRLVSLVGSPPARVPTPLPGPGQRALGVGVAVLVALLVLSSFTVGRRRQRSPAAHRGSTFSLGLDVTAVGAVVVTGVGLASPADYYYHYAAFFGPFLALMVALAAGRLAMTAPRLVAAATLVVLVAGAGYAVQTVRASPGGYPDVAVLDALIPAGACVLGDDAPTLLLADRFSSSVPGCTAVTDAFGTTLSSDGGYPASYPQAGAAVRVWLAALRHSQYVVLVLGYQTRRVPWSAPQLRAYVKAHFRRLPAAGYVVLRRRSPARPLGPPARPGRPLAEQTGEITPTRVWPGGR